MEKQSYNPFEIEVPKPGDIFVSVYESPHNLDLIEGDPRARKLSQKSLKEILKRISYLETQLAKYRYFEAIQNLEQQRESVKLLRLHLDDAKEKQDSEVFRKYHVEIKAQLKRIAKIKAYVEPARKAAIYLDRLKKRRDEHFVAVANEKLYKELRKQMKKEVKFFAQTIIRRWGALGFNQKISRGNRTLVIKPQIEKCVVTEDEIQFKIAVKELTLLRSSQSLLPEGVYASDLVKPETLKELSGACERPVTSPHDDEGLGFENGVYLVVHRAGMLDGLFTYVRLKDMLVKYNQAEREKFPFPVGIKQGRVAKFAYLTEQPHLMFNGMTGAGKTNAMRAILTTFIQYHSPQELQVIITDLKRGSDFLYFKDLPHTQGDIIHKIDEVEFVTNQLVNLMGFRMELMKHRNAVDIIEYNHIVSESEKLPRVIFVIDECGAIKSLSEDRGQSNLIWKNISLLATQSRAAGITLMLGTQQSSGDTIPQNVRDNITFLISGAQRTAGASMGTFGDWRLKRIGAVKGRMAVYEYGEEYLVQTPHAHPDDIKAALDVAKNYKKSQPLFDSVPKDFEAQQSKPFGEELIIETVLNELDGEMKGTELLKIIKHPEASQRKIYDLLKGIQQKELIEFDGKTYTVEVGSRNIRRLVETA